MSDPAWISYNDAARILRCSRSTVHQLARAGRFVRRGVTSRALPSLDRASVEQVARDRAAEAAARAVRRRTSVPSGPPDDGRVWLSVQTAAVVLGVSASWVTHLVDVERLPATRVGRRWWLRRDHVEQAAAARVVRTETSATHVR